MQRCMRWMMRYSKRQTGGGRWKYISFSVLNIPTTPELKSTRITLLFYSVEQTSPARTRLAVCASQSDRPRQERHQASSWRLGSKKQASARLVTHTNHVVTRPLSTTHHLCHLNLGGERESRGRHRLQWSPWPRSLRF